VQIVGRNKEDFSVLQMAQVFEHATGFGKKQPIVPDNVATDRSSLCALVLAALG
jgi:hypothetical protein